MKKQILTILLTTGIASSVFADASKCSSGYDDFKHLGGCLGNVVDSGIGILADLPTDAKKWTDKQHERAREKLEDIKENICDNSEVIKEVVVEKIIEVKVPVERIVYIDRVVEKEVPSKPKQRKCITKRRSDRFGNVDETITCTEWKQ